MKKVRILASLLCLMMLVCVMPVLQVSATNSFVPTSTWEEATAAAMNDILTTETYTSTYTLAAPLVTPKAWGPCNLDFSVTGAGENEYLTFAGGDVKFGEDGAAFGSTQGAMRYNSFPASKDAGVLAKEIFTPFGETFFFAYSFKLSEGGSLESWGCAAHCYNASRVVTTPDDVVIYSSNGTGSGTNDDSLVTYFNDYEPGTEWNDVLIHNESRSKPYTVYMKKATDTTYTKVAQGQVPANVGSGRNVGFGNEYTNAKKGVTFIGTNANVGYMASVKGINNPIYDTMEEIVGETAASAYAFDFNSEYQPRDYARAGKTIHPASATYDDENGMHITNGESWNFYSYENWSPLNRGAVWQEADYIPQIAYVKMKGIGTLMLGDPQPNTNKGIIMDFTEAEGYIPTGGGTLDSNYETFKHTDEWMEYLFVPKATWNGGYSIYAKGTESTGGKWRMVSDATNYGSCGDKTTGITFTGTDLYVKSVRLFAQGVAETETIPAGATYGWYDEAMNENPEHNNVSNSGTFADGVITYEDGGNYTVGYGAIPVNGYAEFRSRAANRQNFIFVDENKNHLTASFSKDYESVAGGQGNGFMADGSSTWRTWRVVRTPEGYSLYTKVDGDAGWLCAGKNMLQENSANAISSSVSFVNGSGEGWEGQLDYFKIYGPAPTRALTLTDGVSTTVMNDGHVVGYGSGVRPILTSGKLLVANYNGDTLMRVKVYDAEDYQGDETISIALGGSNKVKFYLWDDFNKMSNLDDVITITIPQ